jgi:ACDE family multidrug resistance protein
MGSFFGPFGGNMILPMFKVLKLDFGVNVLLLGLSITVFMVPFSITQLFSGILSDILYGRRVMVAGGFMTYGLGALIASISPSIWVFLLSRGVQGIGAALVIPSVMALVGDIFRREIRGKIMGGMAISTTLGGTLGPLFGGYFADLEWRFGFVIVGGMSFTLALLASSVLSHAGQRNDKGVRPDILKVIKENLMRSVVIVVGLLGFILFYARISVYTYLADLLTLEPYSLSGGIVGSYLSLAGLGGLAAGFVAGYLADRIGRKRAMLIGLSASLIVLGSYIMPIWYELLPFLLFLMGFSITHSFTPLNTIAIEIDPNYRATIASIYGSMRFLGYAFGPMLAYPLYAHFSLNGVIISSIAAIVIGLMLTLTVLREKR